MTGPRLAAALLAAALLSSPAAAAPLDATWGASCAPWDGAAIAVAVESLKLRIMIYGPDIARFRAGETIEISARPESEGDTATLLTPDDLRKFRPVAASVRLDPKTGKGSLTFEGKKRALKFRKIEGTPFCG